MMKTNPVLNRIELSVFIFLSVLIISLLTYVVFINELLMWRIIAGGIATSLTTFLLHPQIRGIRNGDIIMVSVLRRIETPTVVESYMEEVPTEALENGRKNHTISVRLWDGSKGTVQILSYGTFSLPEGKLIEVENLKEGGYSF